MVSKPKLHPRKLVQLFMQPLTIQEISKVKALHDLPADHLQWLIDHGEYSEYEEGTVLTKTGKMKKDLLLSVIISSKNQNFIPAGNWNGNRICRKPVFPEFLFRVM